MLTYAVPGEIDDNQPLWVLGDSVLERRDLRLHERALEDRLGRDIVLARYTTPSTSS